MKRFVRNVFLGIGLFLLSAGMTVCAAEDTILNGIKIDQVDVSGMTREEALKALENYEQQLGEQKISLGIGEHVLEVSLSSFGVRFSKEEVEDEALGIGRTGNNVKR